MRTFAFNPDFFYKPYSRLYSDACNCNDTTSICANTDLIRLKIDICEKDDITFIVAEVPGVNKDEISINIEEGNILTIKGGKKNSDRFSDSSFKYSLKETTYGDFHHRFVVPDNIDLENIEAEHSNGILVISLKKKQDTTSNNITIPIN